MYIAALYLAHIFFFIYKTLAHIHSHTSTSLVMPANVHHSFVAIESVGCGVTISSNSFSDFISFTMPGALIVSSLLSSSPDSSPVSPSVCFGPSANQESFFGFNEKKNKKIKLYQHQLTFHLND